MSFNVSFDIYDIKDLTRILEKYKDYKKKQQKKRNIYETFDDTAYEIKRANYLISKLNNSNKTVSIRNKIGE